MMRKDCSNTTTDHPTSYSALQERGPTMSSQNSLVSVTPRAVQELKSLAVEDPAHPVLRLHVAGKRVVAMATNSPSKLKHRTATMCQTTTACSWSSRQTASPSAKANFSTMWRHQRVRVSPSAARQAIAAAAADRPHSLIAARHAGERRLSVQRIVCATWRRSWRTPTS